MAPSLSNERAPSPVVITERDVVFNCRHCTGELVVDAEGAGLELVCPHCRQKIIVPAANAAPAVADAPVLAEPTPTPQFDFEGLSSEQIAQRLSELSHQAKENQSQDVEMRGHVNRATIELHRLQLKLQKLVERKAFIAAEMASLREAEAKAAG